MRENLNIMLNTMKFEDNKQYYYNTDLEYDELSIWFIENEKNILSYLENIDDKLSLLICNQLEIFFSFREDESYTSELIQFVENMDYAYYKKKYKNEYIFYDFENDMIRNMYYDINRNLKINKLRGSAGYLLADKILKK